MMHTRTASCPVDHYPLDDHTNEQLLECEERFNFKGWLADPSTRTNPYLPPDTPVPSPVAQLAKAVWMMP